MFRRLLTLSVLILALVVIGSAFADDDASLANNPNVNPNANACFAGGTLEGRCNPVDANGDGQFSTEEIQAGWIGGWYLIRFQYGLLSRANFPAEYAYLLPLLPQVDSWLGCYDSNYAYDLLIIGAPNTLDNAKTIYSSQDGSCTSSNSYFATLVIASSQSEAEDLCKDIGFMASNLFVTSTSRDYPTLQPNVWECRDFP
jgi:hypothetical protein